jgi:hypothetical protein
VVAEETLAGWDRFDTAIERIEKALKARRSAESVDGDRSDTR